MKKLLFIAWFLVLINLNYSLFVKNNNISDYFLFEHSQNNILIKKINKLESKIIFLNLKLMNYQHLRIR